MDAVLGRGIKTCLLNGIAQKKGGIKSWQQAVLLPFVAAATTCAFKPSYLMPMVLKLPGPSYPPLFPPCDERPRGVSRPEGPREGTARDDHGREGGERSHRKQNNS